MNADRRQSDTNPASPDREVLAHFITSLRQCYRSHSTHPSPYEETPHLAALRLADAVLRDLDGLASRPRRPVQVAIMGPTQVGKSTIVNLLLGQAVAEVSPLAGFTVHPHGFAQDVEDTGMTWLEDFFPGWERGNDNTVPRETLESFTLSLLSAPDGLSRDTVVWDTPDFDSLRALNYQQGVLEVAALADVIVLVVSREKYADLSVWNTLGLLQPLQRPLVVCLNKATPESRDPIVHSLRSRLAEICPDDSGRMIDIVTLPRIQGITELTRAQLPAAVDALRDAVRLAVAGVDRQRRADGVQNLLQRHWSDWTAPVVTELAALREWHTAINTACDAALQAYRDEFLDHPQRFDTFRRAIVELLHLLELPALAQSLTRVRQIITWPARQLFNARTMNRLRGRIQGKAVHDLPGEERVLRDLTGQLLSSLSRNALRHSEEQAPARAFWQALGQRLLERDDELGRKFGNVAHQHYLDFQPQVEAAARELYETLQERPARLNALRAARATTDAAAVALALKTGGIGLNDLLFAPAMVSLTSILTEGALGSYMNHIAGQLKQRQYQAVERQVFQEVVKPDLQKLADQLTAPGLFGITEAEFRTAQRALENWNHG